jgi:penicillin V acylase-like amidase (Ntn superfamily)
MCTCLRLSAENGAIVVGRRMEFSAPLESMIAVLPRGYDGSSSGGLLRWAIEGRGAPVWPRSSVRSCR